MCSLRTCSTILTTYFVVNTGNSLQGWSSHLLFCVLICLTVLSSIICNFFVGLIIYDNLNFFCIFFSYKEPLPVLNLSSETDDDTGDIRIVWNPDPASYQESYKVGIFLFFSCKNSIVRKQEIILFMHKKLDDRNTINV